MSTARAVASTYLEWAKLCSKANYNLATSGITSYPLAELHVAPQDLEINGPTVYGYAPLQERLAHKCGVTPDCVVAAAGTSMANHLAMAALLEPGDDVLIEQPTYGPVLEVASYLQANILRFERRAEQDFQIDPDGVARRITAKTRLICITNLHNPSGALTSEETLIQIGAIAQNSGAQVLVDEVYLDMVYDQPQRSAFHLGSNFVVTTSLTKAYGLSGLRCGWILAQPDLAKRMWRLNDLFAATPVFPGEQLSVMALDQLAKIDARARALLAINREALDAFFSGRGDLDGFRSPWGTVSFPRLKNGSVDEFCEFLRARYETSVVPGQFFEMPNHFRIGIGGDPAMTAEALKRLAAALDEWGIEPIMTQAWRVRIGIDWGGTKIEALAMDAEGGELRRVRIPTPRHDYEGSIRAAVELVVSIERDVGRTGPIGVGIPGTIVPATSLVKNANSTWLNGRPLEKDLSVALGREIRCVNDANCLAVSEAVDGAAAGQAVVFAVILGTGCGGGIALDGHMHSGPNGLAGEWGHNPLPWQRPDEYPGDPCYCGQRGCIERWLCGPALEEDYRRASKSALSAFEIAAAAEAGDPQANAALERYEDRLARALAHVVNLLDPDVIVLGGGLSRIERLYRSVPPKIAHWAFGKSATTPIVPAKHGDSSGVRGAARLWP